MEAHVDSGVADVAKTVAAVAQTDEQVEVATAKTGTAEVPLPKKEVEV
jgi:hypothetical protein